MRLYEITGDTEPEVYAKLRNIYLILTVTADIQLSESAQKLKDNSINHLNEDTQNLHYWILASDRIHKLYNEISQLV